MQGRIQADPGLAPSPWVARETFEGGGAGHPDQCMLCNSLSRTPCAAPLLQEFPQYSISDVPRSAASGVGEEIPRDLKDNFGPTACFTHKE